MSENKSNRGIAREIDGTMHAINSPGETNRYAEQQRFFNEVAARLGVVCFRPTYHAKRGDKNTVLFYTKADDSRCRDLDSRGVPCDAPGYPRQFWSFENSDRNGLLDLNFGNFGQLDLGGPRWREVLEGEIRIALVRKAERDYIGECGFLSLKEGDDYYNDLNRELIRAMKMRYGKCFIGKVNFDEDERSAIAAGEKSPFVEYAGQKVFNFGCAYCIPEESDQLAALVAEWNRDGNAKTVSAITEFIEKLGGFNLIWT